MTKSKGKQPEIDFAVPLGAAAAIAINPIAAKACVDLMSESARFMAERLQRDMELQMEMLACKNPAALLDVQSRFVKETMAHYTDEASRYMQMVFDASNDIAEDAKTGHSRGYDDVPL
ncbi:phasin family protein [Boseongicola aestuarii]|uniref:Phasin protein n=1 Tax=Boseongicola aestuarii TaxID=1470561 RepID=A0A238J509_9RHOB|nr:phasin family protein [Boseongicola aestuarii]SMX25839.1 Phasin protein [Boseongicola aestuarii]